MSIELTNKELIKAAEASLSKWVNMKYGDVDNQCGFCQLMESKNVIVGMSSSPRYPDTSYSLNIAQLEKSVIQMKYSGMKFLLIIENTSTQTNSNTKNKESKRTLIGSRHTLRRYKNEH